MLVQRITAAVFAVAFALFLWWGASRLVGMQRSEERAARAALVRDTLEAAQDTTRVLPLIGALGDSLRAVERRAVQTAQRSDELDRLLKRERVVRDRLEATIAELRISAVAETVFVADGDSVRHATFDVRQAPYTVHAEVALPRAPLPGQLDLRAEMDTLALDVGVGCGSAGTAGVRPASVSVVAPSWASVRLGRVEQAPEVCATKVESRGSAVLSTVRRFVARFGLTVGYSAVRTPSGAVMAGPAVGVGFRVWP